MLIFAIILKYNFDKQIYRNLKLVCLCSIPTIYKMLYRLWCILAMITFIVSKVMLIYSNLFHVFLYHIWISSELSTFALTAGYHLTLLLKYRNNLLKLILDGRAWLPNNHIDLCKFIQSHLIRNCNHPWS